MKESSLKKGQRNAVFLKNALRNARALELHQKLKGLTPEQFIRALRENKGKYSAEVIARCVEMFTREEMNLYAEYLKQQEERRSQHRR